LLLEKGAHMDAQDENNDSALHCASWKGHIQVAKLLIDSGANIHLVGFGKQTPLISAAEEGQLEIVSLLLDQGAHIDVQDEDNATALHFA
ncbi:ankyrin, partial [Gymnopus androsaceus JB14]